MKIQRVMIWVFGVLAMGNAFAQPLPPGTYRNLKPTQPLVLDSGSYTFIGLYFSPSATADKSGGWVVLDARKARSLTLINCTFEGKGKGTGVLSSGKVEIGLCNFQNLGQAVRYEAGNQCQAKIYRNVFSANDTAIALVAAPGLENAKLELSLKCNEFINPTPNFSVTKNRIGLYLGKGVNVGFVEAGIFRQHTLGTDGHYFADGFSYPNGNRWPGGTPRKTGIQVAPPTGLDFLDVHHPDTVLALANSPHWVSIENQSGAPLRYYRYETEFVGWGKAIGGEVEFMVPQQRRKWILDAGTTTDTCTYKIQQPKGQANLMVCEQLVDEQPFLLPTFWKLPGREKATVSVPTDTQTVFLSTLPETGIREKNTILHIWLPGKVQQAVLQYLDGSGQVLQNNPIGRRGWMEAHLDLNYTEPGLYGYRLLVNGNPGEVKKLLVQQ